MNKLEPKFVDYIPKNLEEGRLYISIQYSTAVHKCACGCGNKTVTPISPIDWELTYNGKSVSLNPSIGNWQFPCKSHYWIKNNTIKWAPKWNEKRIKTARERDRKKVVQHFNNNRQAKVNTENKETLWHKIKSWAKYHFYDSQ